MYTNLLKTIFLWARTITGTPDIKYSESCVGIEYFAKITSFSGKEIGKKESRMKYNSWHKTMINKQVKNDILKLVLIVVSFVN